MRRRGRGSEVAAGGDASEERRMRGLVAEKKTRTVPAVGCGEKRRRREVAADADEGKEEEARWAAGAGKCCSLHPRCYASFYGYELCSLISASRPLSFTLTPPVWHCSMRKRGVWVRGTPPPPTEGKGLLPHALATPSPVSTPAPSASTTPPSPSLSLRRPQDQEEDHLLRPRIPRQRRQHEGSTPASTAALRPRSYLPPRRSGRPSPPMRHAPDSPSRRALDASFSSSRRTSSSSSRALPVTTDVSHSTASSLPSSPSLRHRFLLTAPLPADHCPFPPRDAAARPLLLSPSSLAGSNFQPPPLPIIRSRQQPLPPSPSLSLCCLTGHCSSLLPLSLAATSSHLRYL
ncbi:WAS/WASL-interacting protein family member 1-like [Zingiber officinale]|uniref:WAS/WASL-interacting protein family member 1-like n=1 Tax=Zingiber officinale TaxID=94328 RepID=UPI001C4D1180|nr:WAS/WASL-interacting protein family member 1-like [Zingiber officinale]